MSLAEIRESSIVEIVPDVRQPAFQDAQQLLAVLSHFPGVVFAADRDGIITLQHGKGLTAMGLRPEDIVGRSIFDVYANMPSIMEGAHSALDGKSCSSIADFGSVVHEFWCEPLRSDSGEITGIVGAAIDITERRKAQEAFHKTNETLEAVIASASIAIVTLDLEGRVLTWNPAAERIHGWTSEEVIGKRLPVLPPDMQHELARVQEAIFRQGGVLDVEQLCLKKDGTSVMVSLSGSPLHNSSGEPAGAVYMVTDITERKRAAAAMQETKEMAEAANRAKSEFLANMSHEIRTPMNGVLGMTDLALDTNLTSEQRDYLNCVKSSAESLLTVLNDILDFSKIEAGKLALYPEYFHLRETAIETMKALAVRAHQKGLELVCDVDSRVPEMVIGDPTRLRQVLVNLIGNSIKFTETGEVLLQVQVFEQDEKHVCLEFSVTDTGIGIPKERQSEIFQAFTQADGSITRRFGGTGLGLSISSQLVKMMDGGIGLDSEPGLGSTFHFTAVFGIAAEPVSQPAAAESYSQWNVLAVDDNPTNRRVLDHLLAALGMRPAVASSGRTALRLMQQAYDSGCPFRLVLIDAHMPEMDGFTLARRIKADSTLASATIMMLSSVDHRADASLCRECGISAYLVKPIGRSDLEKAIHKALGRSRQIEMQASTLAGAQAETSRTGSVLLVEDNPVNQKLVAKLLEKRGLSVTLAPDGVLALEACRRQAFDLALVDLQMPNMDGFELCARIRAEEEKHGAHLPIIALTAHAMTGVRERCLQAGMDDYISKPIHFQELYQKIDALLSSAINRTT